jgi:ankyrin repeat protein
MRIFKAVRRGNEAEVVRLLDTDPTLLEKQDAGDCRPLERAAQAGHLGVVKLLVLKGANINATGQWGRTALHWAAEKGRDEVAAFLLRMGARADILTRLHQRALWLAFEHHHLGVMHMLLERTWDRGLQEKKKMGWTPLMEACGHGDVGVVQSLVQGLGTQGLDETDRRGKTALHWAAMGGQEDIVACLLNKGAAAGIRDGLGRTPLIRAAESGHLGVVRILVQHSGAQGLGEMDERGRTALDWAAVGGHEEVVGFLLSTGQYADLWDPDRMTPFMLAARWGRVGVLTRLLEHVGREGLEEGDQDERTALHYAAQGGHEEMATFLLSRGALAHVRHQDRVGMTPLILSVSEEEEHVGVVRILLGEMEGEGLDARDVLGRTALHWAARWGHDDIMAMLLSEGAQASVGDGTRTTPLMVAGGSGQLCAVQMLVKHMGPEGLEERDTSGRAVLHWAAMMGHAEVVRTLLVAGADPTMTENGGRTPRALAEERLYLGCLGVFDVSIISVCRRPADWYLEKGCVLRLAMIHVDRHVYHDSRGAPL